MFSYSLNPDGGPNNSEFWNFGLEEAAINDIDAVIKLMDMVRVLNPYPTLWHFRLWSFQGRDTKLERFLAKINCIQIKLPNFDN